jgi:homoserine O-acetyltransferase
MAVEIKQDSVGIVKTRYHTFAHASNPITLECGSKLGPITVAYEAYGQLNTKKSNAVLIVHALSGDAHVAGYHSKKDKKPGWWDIMIGPDKAIDTNRYYVICSNIIGGCKGSTGPGSINPKTNKPYGQNFPLVTIRDMVLVQKYLLDYLGIKSLISVIGGSMGGMQALEWTLQFPEIPQSAIIIAACASLSAQAIAFHAVGRNAIIHDQTWNAGQYGRKKVSGLAVARMLGHITYLSEEGMRHKFGRRLQNGNKLSYGFTNEFQVESYLAYQGLKFLERFDANSYLYITKAMDYYNAAQQYGNGSLVQALKRVKAKLLLISFSSDWLFHPNQSLEIVQALRTNNKDVSYLEIESNYGHDAFLLENKDLKAAVNYFLFQITI